jgi:hypothetical protein
MSSACHATFRGAAAAHSSTYLHHADLIYDKNLHLAPLCRVNFIEHRAQIFHVPGHSTAGKRMQRNTINSYRRNTCQVL